MGTETTDVVHTIAPVSDEELVARIRSGDAEAIATLYSRHFEPLARFAYSILRSWDDAEDVAQDAFSRALERLATLRQPARFGAWARTIARRLAQDLIRARVRAPVTDPDALERTADPAESRIDDLSRALERRDVTDALARLSSRQQRALLMRDGLGVSSREVGEALGISYAHARVFLTAARKRFREEWSRLAGVLFTPWWSRLVRATNLGSSPDAVLGVPALVGAASLAILLIWPPTSEPASDPASDPDRVTRVVARLDPAAGSLPLAPDPTMVGGRGTMALHPDGNPRPRKATLPNSPPDDAVPAPELPEVPRARYTNDPPEQQPDLVVDAGPVVVVNLYLPPGVEAPLIHSRPANPGDGVG